MGGSVRKTTQKQTSAPAPEAMSYYKDLMNRLKGFQDIQYTPYAGQRVAEFTPYQQMAMQGIQNLQGVGAGTLQEAVEAGRRGAAPITTADIRRYQDPYQAMMVDAFTAKMRQQEAEDISKLQGTSISAGAYGGDRAKLAQAQLMRNQEQERNARISELMSKGYSQSLSAAQADREAQARGATQLSSLAAQQFAQPQQQLAALYGAGSQQQALEQQKLNVPYETYLEQRAYPFQLYGFESGQATGIGSQMGGTSTGVTTAPGPNRFAQIAGLGLSLGLAPFTGGMSLAAAPGMVSGLGQASGGRVTEKADGGGVSSDPFSGKTGMFEKGFIPAMSPTRGQGAPRGSSPAPAGSDNTAKSMISNALDLASALKQKSTDPTNPASWGTTVNYAPDNPAGWQTSVSQPGFFSQLGSALGFAHGGGVNIPYQHFPTGGVVNPIDADPRLAALLSTAGINPNDQSIPVEETEKPSEWKTTSEIAPPSTNLMDYSIMARNLLKDKEAPTETAATTADLPQIDVPQGQGQGQAGISQPYKSGEEQAVKGKSFLGSLLGLSPEAEQAGMAAGLAMMASESPDVLGGIGAGGLAGMKYYNELMKAKQEKELKQEEMEKKYSKANLVKTGYVRKSDGTPVRQDKTDPSILLSADNIPLKADEIEPAKEYERKTKEKETKVKELPRAQYAYESMISDTNNIKRQITRALNILKNKPELVGMGSKPIGEVFGRLGATERSSLESLLSSIVSAQGVDALNALKEKSKTGSSGLGALTDKEFSRIASQYGELDINKLNLDALEYNLANIYNAYEGFQHRYSNKWKQEYGEDKIPESFESNLTPEDIRQGRTSGMPKETGATESSFSIGQQIQQRDPRSGETHTYTYKGKDENGKDIFE